MDMNKKNLKKLSKSQLIKLLLKEDENRQAQKQNADNYGNSIVSQSKQEGSVPGKSINDYEDLIIEPPEQFRDKQKKQRPPKPTRKPPLPPKDPFNFDDDIFQTENAILENSKSLAYKAGKIRNSKASRMNSKLKSLKNWMMLMKYITYSKN